jgi:site-specific DNA-methyltransferase (adenine-specific)
MPENTDHPTQKPEKLIAKLILASTHTGGFVFDPFLGSGTTAVVCKKLSRRFVGVEQNSEYCSWALKRLSLADIDPSIQGYADSVFWERNSLANQKMEAAKSVIAPVPATCNGDTEMPFTEPRRRGRPSLSKSGNADATLNLF